MLPGEQNRQEEPQEVTEMAEMAECATHVNTEALGVGDEAGRTSKPVGVVGTLGTLQSPDVRAGRGHLVALVKAQRRRSQP